MRSFDLANAVAGVYKAYVYCCLGWKALSLRLMVEFRKVYWFWTSKMGVRTPQNVGFMDESLLKTFMSAHCSVAW